MPLEKQSLNNFLPNGFETLNQEGYKENFSEDKIATGYEKDVPDIVSGPNLNNLIDVVGKNTNTLNNYVEYLNGMPINNVPTTDENGQLNYINLDDKLTKKQITNCITEIPQRIKLELKDGTLTLKAGSVVIIPNGFEADGTTPKFDEVIFKRDFTVSAGVGDKTLFVTIDGSDVLSITSNKVISGVTDSFANTTWHAWYDTTINIVKRYGTDAGTYKQVSFPIAITTFSDETICSSIDQVFNGFGYIGSTVWADKGVKGLIPNGRNEDGSLKNKELLTDKVLTATSTYPYWMILNYNGDLRLHAVRNATPYTNSSWWHDEQANIFYTQNSTGFIYNEALFFATVEGSETSGITLFQPKLPFRAVDYNDLTDLSNEINSTINSLIPNNKSTIGSYALPSTKSTNLTLGASGSSYTMPANGWLIFGKRLGVNDAQYIELYNTTNGMRYVTTLKGDSGNELNVLLPVRKNDIVEATYNATGETIRFKFYYAEGDK